MRTPLNNFISQIKGKGVAFSNKYNVEIPKSPSILSGEYDLKTISMFCESIQFPEHTLVTNPVRTYGEVQEVPNENLYGSVEMTFICDSDYKIKHFFDSWIQSVFDPKTRHMNYYKKFTVPEINIWALNRSEQSVYKTTLYSCYPKAVGSVQLNYGATEVVKIQVAMHCKYWRSSLYNTTQDDTATAVDAVSKYGKHLNFNKYQELYNNSIGDPAGFNTGFGGSFIYD